MKLVVFGLSISSAWGNGHATLLRSLFRALNEQGHRVHFFEKDVPYYAAHRDAASFDFAELHLYNNWQDISTLARSCVREADAAIVTSYCPDARLAATMLKEQSTSHTIFYDMDTPVTLHRLAHGEAIDYLPAEGLGNFDQVLSFTGGAALERLRTQLNARRVTPLYGWVDPLIHHASPPSPSFASDLSYLGTYAADRQAILDQLLIEPARRLPDRRFLSAGAMFPPSLNRPANLKQLDRVSPHQHSSFFSSSRLTLNVTRASMAALGYCPSGRLFEAAACGTPVLSDPWDGLEEFFHPGEEILIVTSTDDVCNAVLHDSTDLQAIGQRARQRVLDCHTAAIRACQLIQLIEESPRAAHDKTQKAFSQTAG